MKSFKDLTFIKMSRADAGPDYKAVMMFDNGYGVSVLCGPSALSLPDKPYELAVIKLTETGDYKLTYPTLFNGDVLINLTSDDVTACMKIIQTFSDFL